MEEYVTITVVVSQEDSDKVQNLLEKYQLVPSSAKDGGSTPLGPPDLGLCPKCNDPIIASGGENYTFDGVTGNINWTQCVNGHKIEKWTPDAPMTAN